MGASSFAGKLRQLESLLSDRKAASAAYVLEAIRDLRKAHPEAVALFRLEAHALLQLERWAEAAGAFERVVSILPTDGAALAGLAHALHQLNRSVEAAAVANQAADYLPSHQSVLGDNQHGNATYQSALVHLRTGKISTAVRHLRSLVALYPERLDIRLMLGLALWRARARVAAAEHCLSLLEEAPDVLAAHVVLYDIWRNAGALKLAAWHASVIARFDPEHLEAGALFGKHLPADLPHAHISIHQTSAEITPSLPLRFIDQEGEALPSLSSWSQAWMPLEAEETLHAPSVSPNKVPTDLTSSATSAPDDEEPAEGKAHAEAEPAKATAPPDTDTALLKRARQELRRAQGQQLDELIATLERLRVHMPNDPELLSLLAQAYLRRGDADGALKAFHQALTEI